MRSLNFDEGPAPTYLFTTGGVSFFEHPTLGDEAPLLVKSPTGSFLETDFYDSPDFFEVMDFIPTLADFIDTRPEIQVERKKRYER